MKLSKKLNHYKPLFYDKEGCIILSKGGSVYKKSAAGKITLLFKFKQSIVNKVLSRSKLATRAARLGVGTGGQHEECYYFSFSNKIFSYHIKNKTLKEEYKFKNGRGPLTFTTSNGINGFDDGIYFGEYFGNNSRKPVSILKKMNSGEWEPLYIFPENEINHIHSIIPDSIRNCFWILTGDFDHSAAIWIAKNNFKSVTPVLRGMQEYRSCVAFPTHEGLLYATDTQITQNSIRILKESDGKWTSNFIYPLNGPCIYGTELLDYFVISTSTEPAHDTSSSALSLLDRTPGPGIIKNQSDIILIDKSNFSCEILISKDKDIYPYRLFQFGSIRFPQGVAKDNTLYSYSIGNKINDLCTEIFEINNQKN